MSSRLEGLAGLLANADVIATETAVEVASATVGSFPVLIEISKIKRSPFQPRCYFNRAKISGMANKFRQYRDRGEYPRTAILVRPLENGYYELVFGEQRKLAHEEAGYTNLMAFVDYALTDEEASELALDENLLREDLNPYEKTQALLARAALLLKTTPEGVKQLLDKAAHEREPNEDSVTATEAWQQLESFFQTLPDPMTPDSFRVNYLPLLNLPQDVLEQLQQSKLEYTKARAIAGVKDAARRQQVLQEAVEQNLPIRAIRDRITQVKQAASSAPVENSAPTLRSQFDQTYRQAKKSKAWSDPKKARKIERLLNELQNLFES
jgi:ParB family chromosome partitioning protein